MDRIAVTVRGAPGQECSAELNVERFSVVRRAKRSATTLAAFIAGAALAVPIPVVHLFAVPGLLVAAPVAALIVWLRRGRVGGALRCPACAETIGLAEVPLVFPIERSCAKCGQPLFIEPERPDAQCA